MESGHRVSPYILLLFLNDADYSFLLYSLRVFRSVFAYGQVSHYMPSCRSSSM